MNTANRLEEAVVREVREETGYDVAVGRPLTTHSFTSVDGPRPQRPFRSVRVVFEASIIGGSLGTLEVDGTTDFAQWMPLMSAQRVVPRADIIDVGLAAWLRFNVVTD